MNRLKKAVSRLDFSDSVHSCVLKGRKTYAEWVILFCILGFASIIFLYTDMLNTLDNSVLFVKAVFSGHFFDFYSYSIQYGGTNYAANYDVLIYVIYGIWNLPVLFLNLIFGLDYVGSAWCLMWCKLFGIICCVLTGLVICKILKLAGIDEGRRTLAFFTFMSSMLIYLVVFIIAQVDEVGLLFIMLGVYYYLRNKDKKDKLRFYLFFILAMPLKSFAIFIMVPLIALREKRIVPLVLKAASGFILMLVCKLLYIGDSAYSFSVGAQNRDGMSQLLGGTLKIGNTFSVFVGIYVAICIFCFIYKIKEKEAFTVPLFICFLVWAAFFTTVSYNIYWIIFLVPFAILSIFVSGKFFNINMLLNTAGGIAFLLYGSFSRYPLSSNGLISRLFLSKFVTITKSSQQKYGSMKSLAAAFGLDTYTNALNAAFMACLIATVILTCPWFFKKVKQSAKAERGVLWVRLAFMAVFAAVLLYAYMAKEPSLKYDTIVSDDTLTEVNLVDTENEYVFTQDFEVDADSTLSELTVEIDNNNDKRRNFTSIMFEITDDSGETIYSYREGANAIDDEESTHTLKLKNLEVEGGKTYTLKISGILGIEGNDSEFDIKGSLTDYKVYLYRTAELVDEEHPAYLNGEKQEYNICFELR